MTDHRHRRSGIEPLPTADGKEPTRVGAGLDRLMRQMGGPAADTITTLFGRWPELVGEQIAAHTTPIALRRATLVVAVDDPAWASQLRWLERDLTGRVGEALGVSVEAIEVRVRPT